MSRDHFDVASDYDHVADLVLWSTGLLLASRAYWQALIDGPDNDGRASTSSSAQLDTWCDHVAIIDKVLALRNVSVGPNCKTCSGRGRILESNDPDENETKKCPDCDGREYCRGCGKAL